MWRRSEDNKELPFRKDNFTDAAHIPAILNVGIDQESRKWDLRTEWKLHESIFDYIKKYLEFYSSVDLFTSRINAQFPQFIAYRPDPKAKVTNAFWFMAQFVILLFCPAFIHRESITKSISENATAMLVVPN